MSGQPDLFAPPPSPPSTRRSGARLQSAARWHDVFFALRPDAADAQRLAAHGAREAQRLHVDGKPLEPGRLHVSLYLVARYERGVELPQADVERWMRAAGAVRVEPFDVVFDALASFGGETNPLVMKTRDGVGVAGLRRFQRALGIELANAGEEIRSKAFEPHVTLSYRGMRIAEQPIAPIRWAPHELVLIDSHVGAHIHEVVERWPLRA